MWLRLSNQGRSVCPLRGEAKHNYLFANNNPLVYVDPTGLWSIGWGGTAWLNFGEAERSGSDGFASGLRGGASITASTLSFRATDKLGLTQSAQYQGGAYTGTRVLATVGREAALAASGGIALRAANGALQAGRATAAARWMNTSKTLLGVEVARGGFDIGGGAYKFRQGDYIGGSLQIAGGALAFVGANGTYKTLDKLADAMGIARQMDDELLRGLSKHPMGDRLSAAQRSGYPNGAPDVSDLALPVYYPSKHVVLVDNIPFSTYGAAYARGQARIGGVMYPLEEIVEGLLKLDAMNVEIGGNLTRASLALYRLLNARDVGEAGAGMIVTGAQVLHSEASE